MESLLNAIYYRNLCPSSTQLLDYHLGLLASADERAVRTHVELCPHCAADVRQLFELGLEEQPAAVAVSQRQSLLDRLRQLVPNRPLLPAFIQPVTSTPALRSGGIDDMRVFLSGDLRVTIAVNRMANAASLECSVLDQEHPYTPPTGIAILIDETRLFDEINKSASQQPLDEYGLFTFTPVNAGSYTLLLQLPAQNIYVHNVLV